MSACLFMSACMSVCVVSMSLCVCLCVCLCLVCLCARLSVSVSDAVCVYVCRCGVSVSLCVCLCGCLCLVCPCVWCVCVHVFVRAFVCVYERPPTLTSGMSAPPCSRFCWASPFSTDSQSPTSRDHTASSPPSTSRSLLQNSLHFNQPFILQMFLSPRGAVTFPVQPWDSGAACLREAYSL